MGIVPYPNLDRTFRMLVDRRARHPGGTYFFMANLLQHASGDLVTRHLEVSPLGASDTRRDGFSCYVHINPLKHGLIKRATDWPPSRFHRLVEQGIYPPEWAGDATVDLLAHAGGDTAKCPLVIAPYRCTR
jgi:hypothetical protein